MPCTYRALHLSLLLPSFQVDVFKTVWQEQALGLVTKLRGRSIAGPKSLASVNWKLQMQMGQRHRSKLNAPSAILDLAFSDGDTLAMEFSHDELRDFFGKLERVQAQLDSLS